MARDAVVIGSGAAGSVAAWELARQGWSVTVLERGRRQHGRYGSDELKGARGLGFPDGLLEPVTTRTQAQAADGVARSAQGALGQLGAAVGGTTLHYNAKFPRFWAQDFKTLSELGPIDGAQVADWPIDYDDLAPYYDEVEKRVGVQGDVAAMPERTLAQSPRKGGFPMAPNPISYAGKVLRDAAAAEGWSAYPQPAAVNSRTYKGRPACVSCGLCSGFGCAIDARGDALNSWLAPALKRGGVRVIARAWAYRIAVTRNGKRATGVRYFDRRGKRRFVGADLVVVAGSPINTARLLLLSRSPAHPTGLGNGSDQVGRNMMFHAFTLATAVFPTDLHPIRSQSNPLQMDDLMGPFTGADVQALGVPWVKGGLVQVAGALPLYAAAGLYAGYAGYGQRHKDLMRLAVLHRRIAGSQLVGEDLPQAENRVDLDPEVRDLHGRAAPRVTYSSHAHERAAATLFAPQLERMHLRASGAVAALVIPNPLISDAIPQTAHLAGTARMGTDAETSVCDAGGRLHETPNVVIADASTFPSFPGFNPTNTIMANALRITRRLTK